MSYTHILVAVAATPESQQLLAKAVSIARPVNARISLITLVSDPELYNQFAAPMPDPVAGPDPAPMTPPANNSVDQDLADVKQAALTELRPLVDKLDVDPEEKFNTYLLLVRSTDDKDLIAPAHEAAKAIIDEAKKAQALLDIIKEIDFLSSPQQ